MNIVAILYVDPMSTISFMRECISEPVNPGPLLIIRNNFPFTFSLFLFPVIIKFENIKIFPLFHFKNQNTITIPFIVYHCIAYYFYLHICLFSIAYLFSVVYTYTHLVLDNHLVRLRAQSNSFYFAGF
jgi:hypothetical protein